MSKKLFQLTRVTGQPVSDHELLSDLTRVASLVGSSKLSASTYRQNGGKFDERTIGRRFGSWNKAIAKVGLVVSNEINIQDDKLFENILVLWQHYGRQPRQSELARPPSKVSQGPYKRRFGGWIASLEAFVDYANGVDSEGAEQIKAPVSPIRRTGRDPSLRLRWKVLLRDRFTCQGCGRSPATGFVIELQVDHFKPWSKGGETELSNLRTLCGDCNLGKSNLE